MIYQVIDNLLLKPEEEFTEGYYEYLKDRVENIICEELIELFQDDVLYKTISPMVKDKLISLKGDNVESKEIAEFTTYLVKIHDEYIRMKFKEANIAILSSYPKEEDDNMMYKAIDNLLLDTNEAFTEDHYEYLKEHARDISQKGCDISYVSEGDSLYRTYSLWLKIN